MALISTAAMLGHGPLPGANPEGGFSDLNTYVVIDVTCLTYRAMFAAISDRGSRGFDAEMVIPFIIENIFTAILNFGSWWKTNQFVFCFDSKNSKRRAQYPDYKSVRRARVKTPQEERALELVYEFLPDFQVVLPTLGFQNAIMQDGLEADDLLAWIANNLDAKKKVLITDDADLYQCLNHGRVILFRPCKRETYRQSDFEKEYGIKPSDWPVVKAIGGCTSDSLPGIPGVGENTVIKYLRGELPQTSKRYTKLTEGLDLAMQTFLPLVSLPHEDTAPITILPTVVDTRALGRYFQQYNLKTLLSMRDDFERFARGSF